MLMALADGERAQASHPFHQQVATDMAVRMQTKITQMLVTQMRVTMNMPCGLQDQLRQSDGQPRA
jgi:hypothetical protein